MVTYPAEEILVARGQYSTLSSERKQQIERVMKNGKGVVDTMRQYLLLAANGVQERPTTNRHSMEALRACLGSFENAWNRIDELNGVQETPTEKREHLIALRACLGNWETAWNRIDELNTEREALHAEAWDAEKVDA